MYLLIIFIGGLLASTVVVPFLWFLALSPYASAKLEALDVEVVHKKEYAMAPMDHIFVAVGYSYRVEGVLYTSNRISVVGKGRFLTESKAKKFAVEVRKKSSCFYSVKNPEFSFIYKKMWVAEKDTRWAALLAGSALIILGVYGSRLV